MAETRLQEAELELKSAHEGASGAQARAAAAEAEVGRERARAEGAEARARDLEQAVAAGEERAASPRRAQWSRSVGRSHRVFRTFKVALFPFAAQVPTHFFGYFRGF